MGEDAGGTHARVSPGMNSREGLSVEHQNYFSGLGTWKGAGRAQVGLMLVLDHADCL